MLGCSKILAQPDISLLAGMSEHNEAQDERVFWAIRVSELM
jgi:hypothetical protein